MSEPQPRWMETQATVTECHYQFARINTLTFGISTEGGPFRIGFAYRAHGEEFTGEFFAPEAIAQGTGFSLTYNPLRPQENSKSAASSGTRGPLIALGVAGSILLSLIYLGMMRGCS